MLKKFEGDTANIIAIDGKRYRMDYRLIKRSGDGPDAPIDEIVENGKVVFSKTDERFIN